MTRSEAEQHEYLRIVAIDGPAGSGKSTVARALAARLGLVHLDTGAVYRTVAVRALELDVDLDDGAALVVLAQKVELTVVDGRVHIDGREPGSNLRTRDASIAASRLSVHPEVRKVLVAKQRAVLEAAGGVAEGRDIGTVVAPDAPLKIFCTASPIERARRRRADLEREGHSVDLDALAAEIAARDERDASRPVSPLVPAPDAVVVDTTGREADEVIEEMLELARSRGIVREEAR